MKKYIKEIDIPFPEITGEPTKAPNELQFSVMISDEEFKRMGDFFSQPSPIKIDITTVNGVTMPIEEYIKQILSEEEISLLSDILPCPDCDKLPYIIKDNKGYVIKCENGCLDKESFTSLPTNLKEAINNWNVLAQK